MRAAALAPSPRSAAAFSSAAAPLRRASAVTPLAAKPTKAADFRGLSNDEIDTAVAESKRALFDMRIAQKTRQDFKGSDFGWHKTKIAQMLTIKRERELAEGVSKRDSRSAEKRAKVEAGFGQF